jgi:hypothetical protein
MIKTMEALLAFRGPGLAFLLTLVFGFWLSRVGRPYNGVLFNIHKLLALGAVIAAAVQFSGILRGVPAQALSGVALVVAGAGVIALFATGALMSLNNPNYALLLNIHRVAPALVVIPLALAAWLLTGRPG